MQVRHMLLFITFLLGARAYAAEGSVWARYYVGAVGTHPIYARLESRSKGAGTDVTGEYSYGGVLLNPEDQLVVEGSISVDGHVEMRETTSSGRTPVETGRFAGQTDDTRIRITGEWTDVDGKKLPFALSAYAKLVLVKKGPNVGLLKLEFLDTDSEIARFADKVIREQASRRIEEAARERRSLGGQYTPTCYSYRLICVVASSTYPLGAATREESLVFGYKDGGIVQLTIEDLFRRGVDWKLRLEGVVKKRLNTPSGWYAPLYLPMRLRAFTIVGRNALRLYLEPRPEAKEYGTRDVTIAAEEFADLIDPQGPLGGIVKPSAKWKKTGPRAP